ncbi:MAG: hypothetical protein K2X66_15875 [Cyanobacteria bacterium]|nr:hypothetical protein [Cyanobacteriota bacterium]
MGSKTPPSPFRLYPWVGVFLGLMLWVTLLLPVEAYQTFGFGPQNYKNPLVYGEGVYFAPYEFKIYAEPDEKAKVVEGFRWSKNANSQGLLSQVNEGVVPIDQVFLSYYPALDVAMMAVVSENGNGWAEVVYNQAQKKTGWVKLESETSKAEPQDTSRPKHFGKFQTWLDFMRFNSKINGVYWLNGVSQYNRMIRTTPDDAGKTLDITVIRSLKVKHIRGNWMLVEVLDFGNKTPMGWVRWRDEEGRLMVFTNFTKAKSGVFTTLY